MSIPLYILKASAAGDTPVVHRIDHPLHNDAVFLISIRLRT